MLSNIIKTATAPLHKQLEQALFSAAIMNGSFSLSDYNTVLRINYFVHHLIEPVIFAALKEKTGKKIDLHQRGKLSALKEDMHGSLINLSEDEHLPVDGSAFANESEALGALYVLEGATLGGQVIIRQLKKNPLFASLPLAYYNVYAGQTGALWKQFLEVMNQCDDHKSVLAGARRVYGIYLKATDEIKKA